MSAATRLGFFCAVAANVIWGLFPIYWNLLQGTAATELVCHRIVWAFVFSLVIAVIRFRFSSRDIRIALLDAFGRRQTWTIYATSAVLIAINWGAFLYAVTHQQILLSSLGYYISPLLNVLLGVFVLGERLSPWRWSAVGFAAIGVATMTLAAGQTPWVSLVMASSFAGYALVKKKAKLDPLYGLFLETTVLLLPSLFYMMLLYRAGCGDFGRGDWSVDWLLIIGGLLTLLPLALFSAAAQRIPLTLVGVLQYVGPTLQFIVGAFYFGEPMSLSTLTGFGFVWFGVAVFLLTRR